MRRIAVAAVGVLFAGSIVGNAQQPTPPTFRAGTTLVDFTVVAVDVRGNPVTDLRRDEISIVEDESNREVAFFQFAGKPISVGGGAAGESKPLPSGTFTNRTEYAPNAPRHLIAIVLDFINSTPAGQTELQTRLLHYLKQLPEDARVGLYILSEHAVAVHDFTRDTASLRARLEKGEVAVQMRPLVNSLDVQGLMRLARTEQEESWAAMRQADERAMADVNEQIMSTRRKLTLAALESVGHHLAGVGGSRSIVWVSQGFPLTDGRTNFASEVRDFSQRLASHGIAVYPIAADGVTGAPLYGGGLGLDEQGRASSHGQRPSSSTVRVALSNRGRSSGRGWIEGTGELMASITGGRVIRNNNDPTDGLRAASDDLRSTYSLGFYAVNNPDNQWHRLRVRVSRPGVTIRHRQGYVAASTAVSQSRDWPEEQWNDIAFRPLISTALRLDAVATFAAGTFKVALSVASDDLNFREMNGRLVADVDIAVVEKTSEPTNVRVQSASIDVAPAATLPATVPVASEFALNPQTVSVRVIVRDKSTGRYGSVDLPLSQLAAP